MSKSKTKKLLRVVGCARSATLYTRGVLKSSGVVCGHEYVGRDGTVSHRFLYDYEFPVVKNKYPQGRCCHVGEQPSMFYFLITAHQVRHPLKVVDSVRWTRAPWSMVEHFSGESIVDEPDIVNRSAMYVLEWNNLCEKEADFTYRIEDELQSLFNVLKLGKVPTVGQVTNKTINNFHRYTASRFPKHLNTYAKKKAYVDNTPIVTWSDIRQPIRNQLKEQCERYGYKLDDDPRST